MAIAFEMIKSEISQRKDMLPITEQFIQETVNLGLTPSDVRLFIIQHLLEDTEHFIQILTKYGFQIGKVIGIEYSSKSSVLHQLREDGIDVTIPPLAEMEVVVKNIIDSEFQKSRESSFRLLIHEVGGYCAPFLRNYTDILSDKCIGIVEETKQGLWRYENVGTLLVPLLEIADSKLKKVEAIHVGEAIARAVESDLLELGLSLCSCCLGVLGFGDIGASVAASLRRRRGVVSCYDPNPLKTIEAKMLGFACPVKERILTESVLIVGATGVRSLTCDELPILRDGVVLVSASSRDLEFPIRQITEISKISSCLTEFVSEFIMPWGKRIRIVNCGCPVNFRGHSLPISVSDLIFCQIAACIVKLITQRLPPGIHRISIDDEKQIASLWLETYG